MNTKIIELREAVKVLPSENKTVQLAVKAEVLRLSEELANGTCAWTMEEDDERIFGTACGEAFLMEDGTPTESDMRFCPFCSKRLVENTARKDDE